MRITVEATALLGRRTGVGRYVANLLAQLPGAIEAELGGAQLEVMTWSWRSRTVADLPPGMRQRGPRVPARLLRATWSRSNIPPIEWLVGRTALVHGTNFVSPPTRRAAEVVTVHDLSYLHHADTVDQESLRYQTLVPRALARGAHVVTPSEAVAELVRAQYRVEAARVTATPLGVDSEWFTATPLPPARRAQLGLPNDYLVFVGSAGPRKNLERLVQAHTAARASDSEVPTLVLAGSGSGGDRRPAPGLLQTGWLDDVELRSLVAGARALVLPSIDEGFGLPVLESLATGRPVLAADISALREVGGPMASYADPYDVDGLAAGLLTVLDEPQDVAATQARKAHAATFSWSACALATARVYRDVIAR